MYVTPSFDKGNVCIEFSFDMGTSMFIARPILEIHACAISGLWLQIGSDRSDRMHIVVILEKRHGIVEQHP